MKIKIALFDSDEKYVSRFFDYFERKYSDSVDLHVFYSLPNIKNFLEANIVDILLAKDKIPFTKTYTIPIVLDLVENTLLNNSENCIFKYQKMSHIYKDILNIYSNMYKIENINSSPSLSSRVISYFSLGSGEGSSTVAISHAKYLSSINKKVLYLDLQLLSAQKSYFDQDEKYSLSDVIYNLKINKGDILGKIFSAISVNPDGISFIKSCTYINERREMGADNIDVILTYLVGCGKFDYIIVDSEFDIDEERKSIFSISSDIYFVVDGTTVNNIKINSAIDSIRIIDKRQNTSLENKIKAINNKYDNDLGDTFENSLGIKVLGYLPKVNSIKANDIVNQLAKKLEGIKWN